MKVLQVNAVYGNRSTGVIVKDINNMLKKKGHKSYVAYRESSESVVEGIKIGGEISWKVHALYTRMTGKQGQASIFSTYKFLREVKKRKIELIHLHNIHSNFLHYPLLFRYAQKKNIPIVMTLHDSWLFTGKCYHFLDCGCEKWKIKCEECPKRFAEIPSVLQDNSHNVFELRRRLYCTNELYVVGCSKWITQCAKESPLFSNATITQIYNGIDTKTFSTDVNTLRAELGLDDRFVIVTMANKWFHEKNREVRETLINNIEKEDRIVIVGCNEEQLKMESENEKLIQLGYITDCNEIAKIYATGNVFLNMTFVDTLPTVNMEAAACGTPVITYDAGGSGELVDDKKTGYIVEPLNKNQLIEAIKNVKAGKIKREDCANWAKTFFDKNENYNKYIELYELIWRKHGKTISDSLEK